MIKLCKANCDIAIDHVSVFGVLIDVHGESGVVSGENVISGDHVRHAHHVVGPGLHLVVHVGTTAKNEVELTWKIGFDKEENGLANGQGDIVRWRQSDVRIVAQGFHAERGRVGSGADIVQIALGDRDWHWGDSDRLGNV